MYILMNKIRSLLIWEHNWHCWLWQSSLERNYFASFLVRASKRVNDTGRESHSHFRTNCGHLYSWSGCVQGR